MTYCELFCGLRKSLILHNAFTFSFFWIFSYTRDRFPQKPNASYILTNDNTWATNESALWGLRRETGSPHFQGFRARVLGFSKQPKPILKTWHITKLCKTTLCVLNCLQVFYHAQGHETIGVFLLKFYFCDSFCGGFSTHRCWTLSPNRLAFYKDVYPVGAWGLQTKSFNFYSPLICTESQNFSFPKHRRYLGSKLFFSLSADVTDTPT